MAERVNNNIRNNVNSHLLNGSVTFTGTRQVGSSIACLPPRSGACLPTYTCGSRAESHGAHQRLLAHRRLPPRLQPRFSLFFVLAPLAKRGAINPAARPPRLHRNVKPALSAENASRTGMRSGRCARVKAAPVGSGSSGSELTLPSREKVCWGSARS